jgi:hypothetical protein
VSSVALDHVGVVTRDLPALAGLYERLGFTLAPLARQSHGRIGNRCVMLHGSYIELLAVVDPNARSATLDRFLARYAGAHILAFTIDDPEAELRRLWRAGVAGPSVAHVERPVDDMDLTGPRARFALIQLPDQPEGRINLVRHLTPEALWQERLLRHANNATDLDEVTLAVAEPAVTAARLSRLIGCVVTPGPGGGFALDLAHGQVRLRPPEPGRGVVPCIVGLSVHTSDGNAAVSRLLAERRIPHRSRDEVLILEPDAAGGAELSFIPDTRGLSAEQRLV